MPKSVWLGIDINVVMFYVHTLFAARNEEMHQYRKVRAKAENDHHVSPVSSLGLDATKRHRVRAAWNWAKTVLEVGQHRGWRSER